MQTAVIRLVCITLRYISLLCGIIYIYHILSSVKNRKKKKKIRLYTWNDLTGPSGTSAADKTKKGVDTVSCCISAFFNNSVFCTYLPGLPCAMPER